MLVAFTIPAVTKINEKAYSSNLRKLSQEFEKEIPNNSTLTIPEQHRRETIGFAIRRASKSADKTPVKRGAKGIVVTKTIKGLKLTDNGVVKLQCKVVSKTEMKQYKHPMYKPLFP